MAASLLPVSLLVMTLSAGGLLVAAEQPTWTVSVGEPATMGPGAATSELPVKPRSDIIIDGDLSEWGDRKGLDLSSDERRRRLLDWRGDGDCSARLWLAYSPKALLLAIRVRDDKHEPKDGNLLWQGDSLQIATATDIRGPDIGIAAGTKGANAFCWNADVSIADLSVATRRNGDATTYEVALPWSLVAGGRLPNGLFGIDVLVNDNDGNGRRGFIELTPGIGATRDISRFALIALAGTGRASPQVAFTPSGRQVPRGDENVTWNAWVYLPPSLEPAAVRISLQGPNGIERTSAESSGRVKPGQLQAVSASWRPSHLEEVALSQVTLEVLDARATRLTDVITAGDFAAAANRLVAAQQALITANSARPQPNSYARAGIALARHVLALSPKKIAIGENGAYDDYQFATRICATLEAELLAVTAGTRPERTVPTPTLDQLRIAKGNFWSGDEPVMLVGPAGFHEVHEDLDLIRDLGFNSASQDSNGVVLGMVSGSDSIEIEHLEPLRKQIERCTERGFTWAYSPSLHYFPLWALRAHPDVTGGEPQTQLPDWSGREMAIKAKDYGNFFPFSIASPTVRSLVTRMFATAMPFMAKLPGSGLMWLMNEPTYFKDRDPGTVVRFQSFLREQHGAIATVNALWKTAFSDFAEIGLQAGEKDPGHYDYVRFNMKEVGDWFSWLGAEARKGWPDAWISNKPMSTSLFVPENGIDFEREALEWDVPGCDSLRTPRDAYLSFDAIDATLLFDFQKSVAPDKPLADHEYHWCHEPGLTSEYTYATYWQGYLHGLRWSQFWVWMTGELSVGSTDKPAAGSQYTVPSQPEVLWGAATAALDLRRLSRYVAAFPGQAQVAITFSKPSLFRTGGRDRILTAWRAAVDLDAPIGFATDRMISQGLLKSYRLLVIPGDRFAETEVVLGVQKFLDAGGTVVQIGACYAKDPYDRPLPALTPGKGRIVVLKDGDAPTLAGQLDEAFTAAGVDRPVRVRALDGKPAWPIECRTVMVDGRRVVALIGTAQTSRRIRLEGTQPITGWEELISGERGTVPELTLAPQEVRLLRLSP